MNTYSFNRLHDDQTELSTERLQRLAPSIFAENHRQGLSDKYKQVKTIDIINIMRDSGWLPVKVSEIRVRNEERQGFQKHEIQFSKFENGHFQEIGKGLFARAVLVNSHDGLSSYILHAGLWRQICGNGLVISDCTFAEIRIKHIGFNPVDLIYATQNITGAIPEISSKVQEFEKIVLSNEEKAAYSKAALTLKYPDLSEEEQIKLRPEQPLRIRRYDDQKNDLWTTYNVIQENLIKGGRQEISGKKRTREVKSIDKNIALNKALWTLTNEMAKLKTVA